MTRIHLGGIAIDVVKKDIKNIHLSVYPPVGAVRIAAPRHVKTESLRVFAIAKLEWIKQQQNKLRAQVRETPRDYVDRESHYLWGKRYLLQIVEKSSTPGITLNHRRMLMQIRPRTSTAQREAALDAWNRQQIKLAVPPLIAKWERHLGVRVSRFYVQRMKTRWGSCNTRASSIRLNTELAKKPKECLEYIVVHEMMHLLEPTHNRRFMALMDRYLPQSKFYRDELNRLPVRHEDWRY